MDTTEVAVSTGGKQSFLLAAGSDNALNLYFVVGSASGTAPGLSIDGLLVPLNFDAYLSFTATNPNTPPLAQTIGFLSSSGSASASFSIPPGLGLSIVGVTLHHAFAVFDLQDDGKVVFTSNAAPVTLVW